jgi:hypothetical protein
MEGGSRPPGSVAITVQGIWKSISRVLTARAAHQAHIRRAGDGSLKRTAIKGGCDAYRSEAVALAHSKLAS